ncbi:MAG: hypothetical protein ABEJ89_06775 [Haloarculaceae archaeon]
MDDVVDLDLVRRSLSEEARRAFRGRVDEQAAAIREAMAAGAFDNEDFAVGLEVEVYAINAEPEPVADEAAEDGDEATGDGNEADGPDEAALDADLSGGGGAWDGSLEPSVDPAADPVDDQASEGRDESGDEREDPRPDAEGPYMDPAEWEGRLAELPTAVFGGAADKELGLHNAEINTDPDAFTATGLEVQTTSVEMQIKAARGAADAEHRELVLDAMWTVPPEGGSLPYLSTVEERDGVVVPANMRAAPRYLAIDNDTVRRADGAVPFEVPGAAHTFPTILIESLATSIQPHLQVPDVAAFPDYYNAAIRTLGPVLSLTANSPFLPGDLYNRVEDPRDLLEETHHELRIAAFEQSVNTTPNPKVRVPSDIDSPADVVDRVVADDLVAPFLREWIADGARNTFADEHWEFDHKRGTYWRWLRCVIGGDPVEGAGDERSLRIEYRPIPTQPTARDVIACQTFVAGLLRGIVAADHPAAELPWQDAERSFYSAAREGPDADLAWVTADGRRTTDRAEIYDELFSLARRGLDEGGVPERRVDEFLDPLERRRAAGTTPSAWKIERVREALEDGRDLDEAIAAMQRDYYELSREERTFADWL